MAGEWFDREAGVGLGHRRLSILDLTEGGRQPMLSADGRWVITYNGELYNWKELRDRAEAVGHTFQTTSDTEVLLEVVARHGVELAVRQFVGMYAFILWDRKERRLWIGRDRFGEKPLYYARGGGQWWMASELKALMRVPGLNRELDEDAVDLFLEYKYIPEPYTIFRDTYKLPPGTIAELKADGSCQVHRYWDFAEAVEGGEKNPFSGSESEAADELERRLVETLRLQMVADVPVGAFLSGGVDSSLVVALMQTQTTRQVRTFSIGFELKEYDESAYAREAANHLHTDHTELRVSPEQALELIPELPSIYDEPYADSSAIPTILVSRLARQRVTVSLSGDGGDEVFGGYPRYHLLADEWERIDAQPRLLRSCLSAGYATAHQIAKGMGLAVLARKLACRKRATAISGYRELYRNLVTVYGSVSDFQLRPPHKKKEPKSFDVATPYHYAMACDTVEYLPGDILTKVDRAAMSCSLETRIPYLDHRLVEWVWSLPESYKIDRKQTKKILRRVLKRYVPSRVFDRPKMGFGVPMGEWLRGPLRDWAESLLSDEAIGCTGLLHPQNVRSLWKTHLSRRSDEQYRLWPILMLQAWHQVHMR